MIAPSIALVLAVLIIVLGRRDMQLQASRERVILAELQGKYDAEKRELLEAATEAHERAAKAEATAAADRAGHKEAWTDHQRRIGALEERMRHLTAPGLGRRA